MSNASERIQAISEGDHLLGEAVGNAAGATLIVFGSVHGNEAGGIRAIQRVLPRLESLKENLRGRAYFLAGNTRAVPKAVRFIDSDLNRHWTEGNLAKNLAAADSPETVLVSEDYEQRELLASIDQILATARDEVYAIDLHSTSAEGAPFATVGDTLRNRHFARQFPVTFLLGIEEQLEGTVLEYLNSRGAVTFGFEGGQHFADSTVDTHEAVIWLALVNSGILAREDAPDFERWKRILTEATGVQKIVEIRYRHPVEPGDDFRMNAGFENFQTVRRGQSLARDKSGAIRAAESGLILMPLYQKQGEDGFFLGREVAPVWLRLSEILRRRNVSEWMRFLPGVQRHPADGATFLIDTRIARFFPLQIFHLLGFRKRRWRGNKLVVSRRLHDTKSPFGKGDEKNGR